MSCYLQCDVARQMKTVSQRCAIAPTILLTLALILTLIEEPGVIVYKEIFVQQVYVDTLALISGWSWHNAGLVPDTPRSLAEGQRLLLL